MNELTQCIPDFKTFRVWNATRKAWASKRYSRKQDAVNSMGTPGTQIYIIVTTSSAEVQYEKI